MKPLNRPVIERRGAGAPRQPFKAKAWSHQDDLKAAIGKDIAISFSAEDKERYRLLGADQFTLKVGDPSGVNKSALTFFKGNLLGYEILEG